MTDVRLVATNPVDGVLVPVASNASGQIAVQSPIIEKIPNDIEVEGTVTAVDAVFSGDIQLGEGGSAGNTGVRQNANGSSVQTRTDSDKHEKTWMNIPITDNVMLGLGIADSDTATTTQLKTLLFSNGSAEFSGDVVIGSRGQKWLIRESNGVAMLVSQETRSKVRDLPNELDLVEAALNDVMEKLKMTPPAGWEVWDGSDISQ